MRILGAFWGTSITVWETLVWALTVARRILTSGTDTNIELKPEITGLISRVTWQRTAGCNTQENWYDLVNQTDARIALILDSNPLLRGCAYSCSCRSHVICCVFILFSRAFRIFLLLYQPEYKATDPIFFQRENDLFFFYRVEYVI
jgi:hypothetical protein